MTESKRHAPKETYTELRQNRNFEVGRANSLEVPIFRKNIVRVKIENVITEILVDTGASISMLHKDIWQELDQFKGTNLDKSIVRKAIMVDGNPLKILGQKKMNIVIQGNPFGIVFQILDKMNYPAIMGVDFLDKHNCMVNYHTGKLIVNGKSKQKKKDNSPMLQVLVADQNSLETENVQSNEEIEIPSTQYDKKYYEKNAMPDFSKKNMEQKPVTLDLENSILTESQKQKFKKLISKYRDVFAVDDSELGRTHIYEHKLRLKPGIRPPRPRLYRTNHQERKIIKEQIDMMLENDIIRPAESPFSSPVLLVPKPDGTSRFCSDLREMNKILEEDTYPLPLISDVMDAVGSAKATVFSCLDLRSAFWQVPVHPDSQQYLTINTYLGKFCFKVLPFGLHSSPAAFQRVMNTILRGIVWDFAIPFIDDIIVYSKDLESHFDHLIQIFERLRSAGLKLKPTKCSFILKEVKYLGHIISKDGLQVDPKKVSSIKDFETPNSVTKVKSFLGMSGYYRKFVKDFARSLDLCKI